MKTSDTQPPELPSYGSYWERSRDPFHASSILPALQQAGFEAENPEVIPSGPIAKGWMLIDWCENPIGFTADGEDAGNPQDFEIKDGPSGRPCAYAKAKGGRE